MSVPEAGAHFFGLSKNGSFDAARRGDLITIKIGRLRRVPVLAQERLLEERAAKARNDAEIDAELRRRHRTCRSGGRYPLSAAA